MTKHFRFLLSFLFIDLSYGFGENYNPYFFNSISQITFFRLISHWCYLILLLMLIWTSLMDYIKLLPYIFTRIKKGRLLNFLIQSILPYTCLIIFFKCSIDFIITPLILTTSIKIYLSIIISMLFFLITGYFLLILFKNKKISLIVFIISHSLTIIFLNGTITNLFNLIPSNNITFSYLLIKFGITLFTLALATIFESIRKDKIIYD